MGDRVLVTGASGRVGLKLVTALAAAGDEVVGLVRTPAQAEAVRAAGATATVEGHLHAHGALREAAAGAVRVWHLAGGLRGSGADTPERVNADGTARLVEALRETGAGQGGVMFTSSCAVYGDRAGLWVEEDFPPSPDTRYGRSKVDAEAHLLDFGRETGTPVHVARVGVVYGPGFPVLMLDAVRAGRAWLPGEGENWLPVVHVDDCVAALRWIMARGEAGGITHVAGKVPVQSRTFYEEVARLAGGRPARFWSTYVPSFVQFTAARWNERVQERLPLRARFTPDMLKLLASSVRLKVRRLENDLGFTWHHPDLASGLPSSLAP